MRKEYHTHNVRYLGGGQRRHADYAVINAALYGKEFLQLVFLQQAGIRLPESLAPLLVMDTELRTTL